MKLALIPSNQNTNPVDGYGNELQQVATLLPTFEAAAKHSGFEVRSFPVQPESSDHYELEGLYLVQTAVREWAGIEPCVTFNIHTDSGTYSHAGVYYTMRSKRLADMLVEALRTYWPRVDSLDYSGYVFANQPDNILPLLLELGSHELASDIELLKLRAAAISGALCDRAAAYFNLTSVSVQAHLDVLWGVSNDLIAQANSLEALAVELRNRSAWMQERIIAIKEAVK